ARDPRLHEFGDRWILVAVPGPAPVQEALDCLLCECLRVELDRGATAKPQPVQAPASVVSDLQDDPLGAGPLQRSDPARNVHYCLISYPPLPAPHLSYWTGGGN